VSAYDAVISLNPAFLGDKTVLGAVIANLDAQHRDVIGLEWSEDELSLLDLSERLLGTFIVAPPRNPASNHSCVRLLWALRSLSTLHVFHTRHTLEVLSPSVYAEIERIVQPVSLWRTLETLADQQVWPRMHIPDEARQRMTSLLRSIGLDHNRYFTLHTRSLDRDPERNLDREKYWSVCQLYFRDYGVPTVWIGDLEASRDATIERTLPAGILDLSNRLPSLFDVAALIERASAHIGGDTGLTHLAAAVGARSITVERESEGPNRGFGPFQEPSCIWKLSRQRSTPSQIHAAMSEAVGASQRREEQPAKLAAEGVGSKSNSGLQSRAVRGAAPPFHGAGQCLLYSSVSCGRTSKDVIDLYEGLFQDAGINAAYTPFRTNNLPAALDLFVRMDIAGFTVSQPFKRTILQQVSACDDATAQIGAANTIVCSDGELLACNTDWVGALRALEAAADHSGLERYRGNEALVLGYGGVARALLFALSALGMNVSVMCRNSARVDTSKLGATVSHWMDWGLVPTDDYSVVVNATSLGGTGEGREVFERLPLCDESLCLDVMFGTREPSFTSIARSRGARIATGWQMLQFQAAEQVRLFGRALHNPERRAFA
jgi:shikimate dehydrogenase